MTTTTEQDNRSSSPGLTPLIRGIIEDAGQLVRQQLSLFQSEIKTDLRKGSNAALPIAIGMAASLLAGFFVFMMVAHLTVWLWPQIPLFAAYGVIGLVLSGVGAAILILGKQKLDAVEQIAETSVESLKENVSWTAKKLT